MRIDDVNEDGLLTLAQWFSPSFPVGAFSYSHGLEWSVQTGDVGDVDSFQNWLRDVVQHGAGRNDLILLVEAYRSQSTSELIEIDVLARALSPSVERLLEICQQGAAFARTASDIWGLALPELTYPVSVGAAAKARQIPLDPTARLYLQAIAGNLTSAAIRLVPLGQTEGQKCLAAIAPLINRTANTALQQTVADLGSATFIVDISSKRHETQYSRMFRS
ncbi:MAG: urease accessory protein UreF [Boseongicola sp.]